MPFESTDRALNCLQGLLYHQQPAFLDNKDLMEILRIADFLIIDDLKRMATAVLSSRLTVFSFSQEDWEELADMAGSIYVPPIHLFF